MLPFVVLPLSQYNASLSHEQISNKSKSFTPLIISSYKKKNPSLIFIWKSYLTIFAIRLQKAVLDLCVETQNHQIEMNRRRRMVSEREAKFPCAEFGRKGYESGGGNIHSSPLK